MRACRLRHVLHRVGDALRSASAMAGLTTQHVCRWPQLRLQRMLFNATQTPLSLVSPRGCSSCSVVHAAQLPAQEIVPVAGVDGRVFRLNSGLLATAISLESAAAVVSVWKRCGLFALTLTGAASPRFLFRRRDALAGYVPQFAGHATRSSSCIHGFDRSGPPPPPRRRGGNTSRGDQAVPGSTIETLASRDRAKTASRPIHIRRVCRSSRSVSPRRLRVTDERRTRRSRRRAAAHTGKLAVPEPHPQQAREADAARVEQMKLATSTSARHPLVDDFPYPVVRSYPRHPRTGTASGYPRGIKGEEIPDRRAHSVGRRLYRRADVGSPVSSGAHQTTKR